MNGYKWLCAAPMACYTIARGLHCTYIELHCQKSEHCLKSEHSTNTLFLFRAVAMTTSLQDHVFNIHCHVTRSQLISKIRHYVGNPQAICIPDTLIGLQDGDNWVERTGMTCRSWVRIKLVKASFPPGFSYFQLSLHSLVTHINCMVNDSNS